MAACGQLGNERIRARKRVEGECSTDAAGPAGGLTPTIRQTG
jgi:hypothetical protein